MPTQAEKLLRIEHPYDGTRYAVSEADYKHRKMAGLLGADGEPQTYEDVGYTVTSYEDGTPYEDGSEPTSYAVASERGVQPIGEGGSDHTTIDGTPLDTSQRRDAIQVGALPAEEAPTSTPVRRTRSNGAGAAPASAPDAAPDAAPAS